MKRIWGTVCTATIALAGSALFMPACNHPDASLFIVGIAAQPTANTSGTCMFPAASATETLQLGALLDVAAASSYQELVLIGNQILPQADPTSDKAETARVTLNKVTVHVTDSQENPLGDYTTQVAGFIDVGSPGTPGYGNVQAELIGGAAYDKLAAEARSSPYTEFSAVTSFYFTGTTLGNVTVQSDTFSLPVTVCYGCAVTFGGGQLVGGVCDRSGTTPQPVPCFVGEDQGYPCSSCGDPICDAPGAGIVADAGP